MLRYKVISPSTVSSSTASAGDGIRPAVVGADQQRSPRVASQVAGLGPRLGDRHLNGDVAGVKVVRHVGQLWTSVALDSCQHAERIVGDHGQQLVVEHLASHVESLLVDARYHQLMTRYAAFLRGVNVGGVNLKMADVADALAEAGFANVRTILASGNIILESRAGADATRGYWSTPSRRYRPSSMRIRSRPNWTDTSPTSRLSATPPCSTSSPHWPTRPAP